MTNSPPGFRTRGAMSRRDMLKLGAALGVSASVLQACGSNGDPAELGSEDLKGKSVDMTVLGIAGWPPSALAAGLGNQGFATQAKSDGGYTASFKLTEAPFAQLFQKAATSLATRSQEYNIMISDSQWLGAFAQPKWILPLNDVIEKYPSLDIEWYSDIVSTGYMYYPEGSSNVYGLPQEGDVQVMFVRKDLLENPKEKAAYKAKHGKDLPQTFEDFEKLSWTDYESVLEFFTRPQQDLYGTSLQYSKEYDFFTCFFYPFLFSNGGDIWDAESRNVQGILNTDENAAQLEAFVRMQRYQAPGSNQVGIAEQADLFTEGRLFSCLQWAAMGPAMIPEEMKNDVLVVPPPAFDVGGELKRIYTLGGQPWVLNAFNDAAHQQVAIDYMEYWYQPETQLEFARQGGNPCDARTLNSEGFDGIQPWFRAYKYMLKDGRTRDFWHDPNYANMLSNQQEAFTAYATGQVQDPKVALDYAAYKQQEILFDAGQTTTKPSGSAPSLA